MNDRLLPLLALLALTVLVFAQVGTFSFVDYDDPVYVSENPALADGLTPAVVHYSLTTPEANLWHPLSWLSHALDVSLFGQENAGPHHLHNLVLHLVCVVLVYSLSLAITRRWKLPNARGIALLAAALFAVHPLHVESVAWVSERKGLLSAAFSLGCLLAHFRRGFTWRVICAVLLALALLAKPSAVVVGPLLVALDAFVLRRAGFKDGIADVTGLIKAQLFDKWLLILLSVAAAMIAIQMQSGSSHGHFAAPLEARLTTLPARFGYYAFRTIWPDNLNFSYPVPRGFAFQVLLIGGAALLIGGGFLALKFWRSRPWIGFAWAWAVICFLPVSGLTPVGVSFTTDRYTYLMLCGPFLAIACMILPWRSTLSSPLLQRLVRVGLLLLVGLLAALAHLQTRVWANSYTLFEHSIVAQPYETTGLVNLGTLLDRDGRPEEAKSYYEKVIELKPSDYISHHNLGKIYGQAGDRTAAETSYRAALEVYPNYPPSLLNLALLRMQNHQSDPAALPEAIALLKRACGPQSRIDRPLFLNSLVDAQMLSRDIPAAISTLKEALAQPTNNPALRAELERKQAKLQKVGAWQ